MATEALHAFNRFGLGRRGAEPIPSDIRGWLKAQVRAPDPLLAQPGPSTVNALLLCRLNDAANKAGRTPEITIGELSRQELTAALRHAATTDLPFRERLVWFWSNHFTVSVRAGALTLALVGAFEREAIRPHVTGRFVDMLKAVMRHPGMLCYLDNAISVGPNSPFGLAHHRGLNENLARECLELHTLGVQSGYTQTDVTGFAAMLTGRTVNQDGESPGFVFRADMHEPRVKSFMGRAFPEGFDGSEAALEWIADHPATRRHIAAQLVQHFVADVPPSNCVARVEAILRDTDGDLTQAMLGIIDMDEAWQPLTKFRAPADYVVAVQRALDLPPEPGAGMLWAAGDLGQSFRNPVLPNGWADTATDLLSGETLLKRADWAMTQALRPGARSADEVASATLGDLCSLTTRAAIKNCPTPAEALATLFASPEFVRR